MSGRVLTRLAIALVVLVAIWVAAAFGMRRGDAERRFQPPRVSTKDVDTIRFTGARDTVVLARTGAEAWQVNRHPADRRLMEELLNALADTAASGDLVVESPASYAQVGMDSGSTRRMQVVAHGKTVADLFVGKPGTVYGTGYLRLASDRNVYLTRSALPHLASRAADDWRDKRIGGVATDSVARIDVQHGTRRYALIKQANRWMLSPGGATDSMAVANFLADLRDVRADGFATPAQADSLKFTSPKRRLAVLGADGKPRLSLLFDPTKSGVWARGDTAGTVWRLDSWNADRLTPADSTLKPRATQKPGPAKQPQKVR